MTLQEEFNKDLHDGNAPDGMIRYNSYERKIIDKHTTQIRFENGNVYTLINNQLIEKRKYQ